MLGHHSSPKVSGGTGIIFSESDAIVNKTVSESGLRSGIVPIYSDDDDVSFSVGLNCGLERLGGSSDSPVAALSALSLLADKVLINVNQSLILKNGFGSEAHACHVSREDKR